MAYLTKTIEVNRDWTLITNKPALLQFNEAMEVILNDGDTPTETAGFRMIKYEKYVNTTTGVHVWGRTFIGTIGSKTVRVAEETIL